MMRVFVCAGTASAKNKNINAQATMLGKILAKNNYTYVQGGCANGLMGATLQEFIKYSLDVEFLMPANYYDYDAPILKKLLGKSYKEIKINGEADRLTLIKQCDQIIVMPGGTGTIEELLYCNETARSNEHKAKVTLVNIDGYYDNTLAQIGRGINEGLIENSVIHFDVVEDVEQIKFDKLG